MAQVVASKIPTSDLQDRPRDNFTDTIIASINDSLFDLSRRENKIEVKQFYVTTPDCWTELTQDGDWAGKGGRIYAMKHYDGSIQLQGFVTGGTYSTSAFTLPQVLRPPRNMLIPTSTNGGYGSLSITASTGICAPIAGSGTVNIHVRFMPSNNRPMPLACFPIDVRTGFQKEPVAVIAVRAKPQKQTLHQRTELSKQPDCVPLGVSWRYIKTGTGPAVQVLDIPGLEYGTKQKVKLFIYGSE